MFNKFFFVCLIMISMGLTGLLILNQIEPEFAYLPSADEVLNPQVRQTDEYYDLWGKKFSKEAIKKNKALLTPDKGAVHVTPDLLRLETFGNEVFITDILGLFDGPITLLNIIQSIIALKGKGTTNLQVPLAKTVTIGGKTYRKGTLVER